MALSIDMRTRPIRWTGRRYERATALALTLGIIAWAIVNLANGWVGFVTIVPIGVRGGTEAAISLARFFAAWVLLLIIVDGARRRLRWLACGFIVLGLGQLFFGYLEPILNTASDIEEAGVPDTGTRPEVTPADLERLHRAATSVGDEILGPPGALPEA